MNPKEKPVFDGAYLERYRRGTLTPAEAHALEKAALADPLLSDALEGFRDSKQDTTPDLLLLRSRLQARIGSKQAPVITLPRTGFLSPLMRVAAILLIAVGAAWFTYTNWPDSRETALASNTPNIPSEAKPQTTTESSPINPETTTAPTPAAPLAPKMRMNPIPALPQENEENSIVLADAPKAMAEATDREVVAAAPLKVDEAVVKSAEQVNEVDQAYALKAKDIQNAAKEKSLTRSNVLKPAIDGPEPVGGWQAYTDYLNENRTVAPTASNTVRSYEVVLSFEVDAKGRPTNIRVEESAGAFYDDAARKLLNRGADWKPGKSGSRGQLRVPF